MSCCRLLFVCSWCTGVWRDLWPCVRVFSCSLLIVLALARATFDLTSLRSAFTLQLHDQDHVIGDMYHAISVGPLGIVHMCLFVQVPEVVLSLLLVGARCENYYKLSNCQFQQSHAGKYKHPRKTFFWNGRDRTTAAVTCTPLI